ncbi:hypothetical protein ACZ90_69185 [Streptomyces albus subsp. albus]|nr:hypothetical protein ACZ90_69185 [Streptomyces albus subsp. albus]
MRPTRTTGKTLPALLVAGVLALTATGCGGDDDSADDPEPSYTPSSAPATPDSPVEKRIKDVNEGMRHTSFHASGTTTALGGGTQDMWSDPKQGFHMRMRGKKASHEIYCKDGTTYMSTAMLAETLKQRGQRINVPDRLADFYVTSETGDGCDVFYRISETGKRAYDDDRKVAGKQTTAIAASDGTTSDTYFLQNGAPRLLRMESTREGRTSTTTYDSFGEKFTVKMPPSDKTMPMDEFRKQVLGS